MVRAAALLVLTALGCARAVRYRAAVVEFSPARATVAGLATWTKQEAWQHSLANVERFSPFLDEAARNGSQVRNQLNTQWPTVALKWPTRRPPCPPRTCWVDGRRRCNAGRSWWGT